MEHTVQIVTGVLLLLFLACVFLTLCNRIKLPFTVVLVLGGMLFAWLAGHYPHIFGIFKNVRISTDLILYVFLPTLIFESAFNMDSRLLWQNLMPVLMLAVPGLILSTFIIGVIVHLGVSVPLPAALLLGAILSATDPVAVIALFKQLGAPRRLTMLVDGESLLNDASSIVVARILLGMVLAGSISTGIVAKGALDMVVVFCGGIFIGWGLGFLVGWIMGKIQLDAFVQMSLTMVLAYVSFLVSEKVFHVSGIMASMGAGLIMGGWGRTKISPSIRTYLEHFWSYISFVANSLLFLLIGLRINPAAFADSAGMLVWVILAMLVSRAVIVYGLIPLVTRQKGGE